MWMTSNIRQMPPLPTQWSTARSFDFAGVRLADTDVSGAVESLLAAARRGASQGIHLCNAYTLTLAARDSGYRRALEHEGAVNLPDGTPVTWYCRLAHHRTALGPVRGPDLMKAVLGRPMVRHYLLGGTPQVLADLEDVISATYPEAVIAGCMAPPFRTPIDEDYDEWVQLVKEARADVVWVGLGTPRQDVVISRLTGRVDAVLVGVGAAFDFLSGHKREAPEILHRSGLEWAYRLLSEPRRLWRRYLVGNAVFLGLAVRQLIMSRRQESQSRPRG